MMELARAVEASGLQASLDRQRIRRLANGDVAKELLDLVGRLKQIRLLQAHHSVDNACVTHGTSADLVSCSSNLFGGVIGVQYMCSCMSSAGFLPTMAFAEDIGSSIT
jgi:hypothetical protein